MPLPYLLGLSFPNGNDRVGKGCPVERFAVVEMSSICAVQRVSSSHMCSLEAEFQIWLPSYQLRFEWPHVVHSCCVQCSVDAVCHAVSQRSSASSSSDICSLCSFLFSSFIHSFIFCVAALNTRNSFYWDHRPQAVFLSALTGRHRPYEKGTLSLQAPNNSGVARAPTAKPLGRLPLCQPHTSPARLAVFL